MENKTYIFSWGGGVNSTAILAMIKLGMLPELNKDNTHIVFADTGAEMPYTHEHTSECLQPMARDGWKVKVLRPYNDGEYYYKAFEGMTLEEVCLKKGWIPSARSRWCSQHFKTDPIRKYATTLGEYTLILGIAIEEKHRAIDTSGKTIYPLIEHGIDRAKCEELIAKAELPKARKSGCYLCPLQRKSQWIDLYTNYRDYFMKAVAVEKVNTKGYTFFDKYSLEEKIKNWLKKDCAEKDLFEENRHCLCEL